MARLIDLLPAPARVVRRGSVVGSARGGYSVEVAGRTIHARAGRQAHRSGDIVSVGQTSSGWVILEPVSGRSSAPLEVIIRG